MGLSGFLSQPPYFLVTIYKKIYFNFFLIKHNNNIVKTKERYLICIRRERTEKQHQKEGAVASRV